jgi:hypothetical protein
LEVVGRMEEVFTERIRLHGVHALVFALDSIGSSIEDTQKIRLDFPVRQSIGSSWIFPKVFEGDFGG